MGLRIFCADEEAPIPRPVHMELTCDGDHGLLPPTGAVFDQAGYVAQHAAAMRAGWLERYSKDGRRLFFGPCCSGKGEK